MVAMGEVHAFVMCTCIVNGCQHNNALVEMCLVSLTAIVHLYKALKDVGVSRNACMGLVWLWVQIFKGTNGNSRLHPKKQKLFGAPPPDTGPIPVPSPPPHLATPKQFPPVGDEPALVFDLPQECYRDPYGDG